jgi:hypothetical protein
MNRPYRDVPESLMIECPVCEAHILYTPETIALHESACIIPDDFDHNSVSRPALDPATFRRR